ncbi:MAG TPA: hypothetical protein VFE30_09765 [Anaeromyxobacteraceae bacterium]|jgi:uncharacterized protein involved in exopolysaccharide biosynthesis|nr:hypothetical protein [Anaeromyxobacteraceae bacterium]
MGPNKQPTRASGDSVIAADDRWPASRGSRSTAPGERVLEGEGEATSPDLFDWVLLRHRLVFFLDAPRRHRWLTAAALLGALATSLAAIAVLPRSYHAEARILASRNLVMPALGNPGRNIPGDADAPTRGAAETILSHENLLTLIGQTNLLEHWRLSRAPALRLKDGLTSRFRRPPTEEEERDALVYVLEKRLKVTTTGEKGETLNIEIDWPDAGTAYRVISTAQQNFLETRHALEVSTIAEAISILEGHATSARARVDSALDEFRRAREAARRPAATRPPPRLPVLQPAREDRELANLRLMLVAKRRAIADLEAFRDRRVAEVQARLAEQKAIYTAAHPQVVATRESLDALGRDSPQLAELRREERELLAEYTSRGGKALEADHVEPARGAPASVMQLPDVLRIQDAATEDSAEAQFWRTQLEVAMRKYEELAARIEAARIELDTARAAFKYRYSVIRPAEVPRHPSRPKVPLILLGGVLGGLALAFGASSLLDLRRGLLLYPWQVERQLGIPLLGELDPP